MEPEPSAIESLSAVTLVTTDMNSAVTFYESLGFVALYGGRDDDFTSFGVGDSFLNLQSAKRTQHEIWGRTIFWVADVDALYRRALAAGLQPSTEPADAPWGERYFHILDPDGHELSFARPLPR